MKQNAMKTRIILISLLVLTIIMLSYTAHAQAGMINYWVEKPNIQGDLTEDPEDLLYFELLKTQEKDAAEPYLTTDELGRRFAHLLYTSTSADGSINAYYVRGVFTYVFDIFNEQGEMTIGGVTYRGGDSNQYTIRAKYGQSFAFPGFENGLMPVNNNIEARDIYCAGWALDERTKDQKLLTYASAVTEDMLPTEDMPYENLVFKLTATWYSGDSKCILSSWYEELPTEVGMDGLNRMTYNSKTYVNYPATDYELRLPKGSIPGASDAPGLKFVARVDPEDNKPYPEGFTWQFLFDREKFTLSFDSGIAEALDTQQGIPYQQNLSQYDPGWDENTTREKGGVIYRFTGWFQDETFLGYHMASMYMTPYDLHLSAHWESP